MRTTLDIAPDVLEAARAIADRDRVSIGHAVSSLAREGLASRRRVSVGDDGIPLVTVASGAPVITSEQVRAALDE